MKGVIFMFCNKCGNKVEDNDIFCNKCGFRVAPEMGSITFAREGKFYGSLVAIQVFMDGILVATIKNGTEATVPASIGKHKISFNLWSGNDIEDIEIFPAHPNIKVFFTLKAGAVTSKPRITNIINL